MGFLIEIQGEDAGQKTVRRRELVSEDELLKTHSKEMYTYLKSTLRYEIKIPVKRSEMMAPDFEAFLNNINSKAVARDPTILADIESRKSKTESKITN